MLALVGIAPAGEGKHALQVAADSEQRRRVKIQTEGQVDSQGYEAASAANDLRHAVDESLHRIVAALQDFAVVEQERVGDVFEAGLGLVVVDSDGLLAEIGRGHHQGADLAEGKEQMLQW